jgi:hypothetical protein
MEIKEVIATFVIILTASLIIFHLDLDMMMDLSKTLNLSMMVSPLFLI